jgi:hypothetical protein
MPIQRTNICRCATPQTSIEIRKGLPCGFT